MRQLAKDEGLGVLICAPKLPKHSTMRMGQLTRLPASTACDVQRAISVQRPEAIFRRDREAGIATPPFHSVVAGRRIWCHCLSQCWFYCCYWKFGGVETVGGCDKYHDGGSSRRHFHDLPLMVTVGLLCPFCCCCCWRTVHSPRRTDLPKSLRTVRTNQPTTPIH